MDGLRLRAAWAAGLLLAMLLAGSPAFGESQVDALLALIQQRVLQRYEGTAFAPYVSLGNPALFRRALEWATLRVDPSGLQQGQLQARVQPGNVFGATLTLALDPTRVPPAERETFARNAWHETLHLLEFYHRDREGTYNFNERHATYYEAMLGDVLDPLRALEERARGGSARDEDLRAEWRRIRASFEQGAGRLNPLYAVPDDLAVFAAWSGCFVDFAGLERAYREGRGGEQMQRVVALEGGPTSLSVDGIVVEALARGSESSATSYEGTVQFTLGVEAGSTWTGSVGWDARIVGAGGKPQLRLSGEWDDCRSGYGARAFRFALPDATPPGDYTVFVRVDAQGCRDQESRTFRHTPAPPSPTPSPSPAPPELEVSIAAPTETAVGRVIAVTAAVSGGVPPYRYEWTTSDGHVLAKESLHGRFSSPGARTLTLRVWDRGDHALAPVVAAATVQVHPILEVRIEGPVEVETGKDFVLTASINGGKPPIESIWIASTGETVSGPSVTGHAGHPDTSPARITFKAMDSLDPPQVAEATAAVAIRPAESAPGGAVGVESATEADFVGRYLVLDTTRSPDYFHGEVEFLPGGQGFAREWVDGRERICNTWGRAPHPILWSWRNGILTYDWRIVRACAKDGCFSGPVQGTTLDFVLTGRWFGGSSARIRFQRMP